MFERVLVANRGEIAVRVIRALHELGIEAVAVYSTADRDALHVELADQAVCIGPPSAAESYLRISNVVAAAETTGCDAVHPGYGFLAENAEFVRACEDSDLAFIGPPADVVEQMGDKVRAKEAMRAAGVPLVPGSDGTAELEELRDGGGGTPASRCCSRRRQAVAARACASSSRRTSSRARSRAASAEAEAAFGDGSVYVEKLVSPARHVEIQVLCDADGGVLTLGERECSIQRRHQKLVEESPSDRARRDDARGDGGDRRARVRGDRLPQRRHVRVPRRPGRRVLLHRGQLPPAGRASGLRARHRDRHRARADPDRRRRAARGDGSRAAARPCDRGPDQRGGSRTRLPSALRARSRGSTLPLGPGVRVDTAVRTGSEIPPYYDSMIAKLIVWDETRDAAIARAERALDELVVEGIPTTRELALDVLGSPEFRSGDYSTSTLDELEGRVPSLAQA